MLIIALITIMTVVALPSITITPSLYIRTVSLVLISSSLLSFNVGITNSIGSGVSLFSGLFDVTSLTTWADFFIFAIGSLAIIGWAPTTINSSTTSSSNVSTIHPTISEYGLLVLFTTAGASFLISSADLVSMFLSIELQSFGVYILATVYRDSLSSTSSGLKYFLLGGLSSCFILLGSAILYTYTGTTNLEVLYSLISVDTGGSLENGLGAISIAWTIIIIGYLFKIAAAPLHNWAPDVYDGVPTIVSMWLTTMPKLSILVFILGVEIGLGINITSTITEGFSRAQAWGSTLLIASLLSLLVGTILGLAQYRIKRLLAYSTISHVGFLLLALATNSELGTEAFILYLVQYSLTSINTFLTVIAIGYLILHNTKKNYIDDKANSDVGYINSMSGVSLLSPYLGLALASCLFSIAGVPPLLGFFAKQSVLYSAIGTEYTFMAFVGVVVSVISASYYLIVIRVIHFDSLSDEYVSSEVVENKYSISNVHAFTISFITLSLTLFMFNSSLLFDSCSILALNYFSN